MNDTAQIPGWLALTRAQQHLADLESDWFSGRPVADQVRAAYEKLREAERLVLGARE